MLQEGYSPALIENLGRQAGMPKGALAWADELGLEMVMKYERQAAQHYGPKYIQHPAVDVLDKMINELGRSGARRSAGFYAYASDEKHLWKGLEAHFPPSALPSSHAAVKERFLFAQVIEAIWCLQEQVIDSEAAANLGSIYGWGFPAFTGGVLRYTQGYGPEAFLLRCQNFQERFGQRFRVPRLFHRLVKARS